MCDDVHGRMKDFWLEGQANSAENIETLPKEARSAPINGVGSRGPSQVPRWSQGEKAPKALGYS